MVCSIEVAYDQSMICDEPLTSRRRSRMIVTAAVAALTLLASFSGASVAGADGTRSRVASAITVGDPTLLPAGDPPRLPYVDVAAKRLHDATRNIDISGLVGTPLELYKVDGGYVVSRRVGSNGQLVFISSSGKRLLWERSYYNNKYFPVAVSSQGGRIVYQRGNYANGPTTTVVRDVGNGRVVDSRKVGSVYGYRGRVLVHTPTNKIVWWTPGRSTLTTVASGLEYVFGADLSAMQLYRWGRMVSIPPGTRPTWEVSTGSVWRYDLWSPDDSLVSGFGDNNDQMTGPQIIDAVTGAGVARIQMEDSSDELTWEDNDHVLVREGGYPSYDWLVRCSLSTQSCERVRTSSYGLFVTATRTAS